MSLFTKQELSLANNHNHTASTTMRKRNRASIDFLPKLYNTQDNFFNIKGDRVIDKARKSINNIQRECKHINKEFMGDLSLLRLTPKNMNIRVIEEFINDVLIKAEYFKTPGTLRKNTGKMFLMQDYGIDRNSLNKSGIENKHIDEIYKALFMASAGIHG